MEPTQSREPSRAGGSSSTFAPGRAAWLACLGNLRNVVRQELVTRQLAHHLPDAPAQVLDVGAGQGTQALRLAVAGHHVTAVEPDPTMRAAFETEAAALDESARSRTRLMAGDLSTLTNLDTLGTQAGRAVFDVVLCHGVLMYLPDSHDAVTELGLRVAPGGICSIVARNGDAMAWRPASRHDWNGALKRLDETDQARAAGRAPRYRNEIGAEARADTLASLTADCTATGLEVLAWYGIRIASDNVPLEQALPDAETLVDLLDVEERLGATDPYRALGTLVHLVARRAR